MRRFVLYRHIDVSGVSGTGVIVEGIEFSDGTAAIRWNSEIPSTSIWWTVSDLMAIHGHNGATSLHYIDDEEVDLIGRVFRDITGNLAA